MWTISNKASPISDNPDPPKKQNVLNHADTLFSVEDDLPEHQVFAEEQKDEPVYDDSFIEEEVDNEMTSN